MKTRPLLVLATTGAAGIAAWFHLARSPVEDISLEMPVRAKPAAADPRLLGIKPAAGPSPFTQRIQVPAAPVSRASITATAISDAVPLSGAAHAAGEQPSPTDAPGRYRPIKPLPQFPAATVDPPAGLDLSPPAFAAAAAETERFADAVDDAGDPGSPDYRQRWQREQSVTEWRLRAQIGAQAFARWQEEAWRRTRDERDKARE